MEERKGGEFTLRLPFSVKVLVHLPNLQIQCARLSRATWVFSWERTLEGCGKVLGQREHL